MDKSLVYDRRSNQVQVIPDANDYYTPKPEEELKEIKQVCELFHGLYTLEEIAKIYDVKRRSKTETIDFIWTSSNRQDIRDVLKEEKEAWQIVRAKRSKIPPSIMEQIKTGKINVAVRLFACEPCDKFWWQNVPERKMVSKCKICRKKYDPVPVDMEWGWAQFHCTFCNKEFRGFSQMGVPSECFGCRNLVLPTRIIPSNNINRPSSFNKSGSAHSCTGCSRVQHRGRGSLFYSGAGNSRRGTGHTCAHPRNRQRKVLIPSKPHDSSGSTVDTFLPNADFNMDCFDVLSGIAEDDDQEGSDQGNKGSDED